MSSTRCKDCIAEGVTTKRVAKYPGPRCYTHHKAIRSVRRQRGREKRVSQLYGITEEQYQKIYQAQGRKCYICQRATGTGKYRLAVDHDHALAKLHDHPVEQGCPLCVRGLLCRKCNRDVLGHLRDEIAALQRAIKYLNFPPARLILSAG